MGLVSESSLTVLERMGPFCRHFFMLFWWAKSWLDFSTLWRPFGVILEGSFLAFMLHPARVSRTCVGAVV